MKDVIISSYNNTKFTYHALERLLQLDVDIAKFTQSLRSEFEILEEYHDDPRGESALILIKIGDQALHCVVSPHDEELIIITV